MKGRPAAARFAKSLSQKELEAVGAWADPRTGLRGPVPGSTVHRVTRETGPGALEDVAGRRARPALARALAADGKRIRGANGDGDGHHGTGAPFALPDLDDGGGELAATHDLPGRAPTSAGG